MTRTRITRTEITKITATTNSRSRRNRTKNSSSWRKNGQKIGEKTETNLETFSKDMGAEAGELLQYLKVENRER